MEIPNTNGSESQNNPEEQENNQSESENTPTTVSIEEFNALKKMIEELNSKNKNKNQEAAKHRIKAKSIEEQYEEQAYQLTSITSEKESLEKEVENLRNQLKNYQEFETTEKEMILSKIPEKHRLFFKDMNVTQVKAAYEEFYGKKAPSSNNQEEDTTTQQNNSGGVKIQKPLKGVQETPIDKEIEAIADTDDHNAINAVFNKMFNKEKK